MADPEKFKKGGCDPSVCLFHPKWEPEDQTWQINDYFNQRGEFAISVPPQDPPLLIQHGQPNHFPSCLLFHQFSKNHYKDEDWFKFFKTDRYNMHVIVHRK